MSERLKNQTAIVTGAASGNGRAIAKRFAEEGANVTIADIQMKPRQGGLPTHELINETSATAQFVETDVTSTEAIEHAITATIERYGSLDIMVNNAGITSNQPIDIVDKDDYAHIWDINVKGVYFGCQKASGVMKEQDSRSVIINISSIAGLFGLNNASLYCASKAAITNLTRQLAQELGQDGIRVNSVNPGFIQTAMTEKDSENSGRFSSINPLNRDGTPEEVANAALFLASSEASYVNGHNLVVDGGLTAAITPPN